ncbi:MAG: hypothetical protein KatS3mg005_2037 [Bryobacteraceae bacterium]|nr:MAG: hypothetical protein KatS3mg005_2037 [Bryobacteraceae bacterium]
MPKITITFHEEGSEPAVIEIPDAIAAVLDQHVAWLQAEGQTVQGKTDLFIRMTWQNWLKPVLERQGLSVRQLAGAAGQQVAQLEAQLAQARAAEEMAAIQAVVQVVP